MYDLTEAEIDLISYDIDRQGLTYTLLKTELLDHICCDIEEEMEQGMTFNEAYRKVKKQMGPKRIRQIQDETLYLISKKYRRMKRLMYGLGISIPIIIIAALILRLQHLPGAGILFSLAFFTAGLLFLPVFVLLRIRDTRRQNEKVPLGFYLTGMIAGILTITGALFKIQHMAGSGIMLTLGLGTMALGFLPIYAVIRIREARDKQEPLNKGYYILGVIAGILFIAGALFKSMHWPGAGVILFSSWLAVAVILLPLLVLNILKQEGNRPGNFLLVVLAFSFISLLTMMQLRRPVLHMLDSLITTEAGIAENATYFSHRSNELLGSERLADHPEIQSRMQAIHAEAGDICTFIQELQTGMIRAVKEENLAAVQPDGRIRFTEVAGKDRVEPALDVLVAAGDSESMVAKLKTMLEAFKNTSYSTAQDESLKTFIDKQLVLTVPDSTNGSWEQIHFSESVMQSATVLSMYRSTVRLIEYELLSELNSGLGE